MNKAPLAYVEHAAIYVKDIKWHIRFFEDVLALGIRQMNGTPEAPTNVWLYGGIQLLPKEDFNGPEGRLNHLGLMVDDPEQAVKKAAAWNVKMHPEKENWFYLPDGLLIELLKAQPGSIADFFNVKARG